MSNRLDVEQTLFHGNTYNEERDKTRLTSSLLRLTDILENNKNIWIRSDDLCKMAKVSKNSYRNRLSDLRIYHSMLIEAVNVKNGLWKYRFSGYRTKDQQNKYLHDLKVKRTKPLGNKELWGKMLETIYIYGNKPVANNKALMQQSCIAWAEAFAGEIGNIKYITK